MTKRRAVTQTPRAQIFRTISKRLQNNLRKIKNVLDALSNFCAWLLMSNFCSVKHEGKFQ
jgi:hypothetical protein